LHFSLTDGLMKLNSYDCMHFLKRWDSTDRLSLLLALIMCFVGFGVAAMLHRLRGWFEVISR